MTLTDLPALAKQFWQSVALPLAELAATVIAFVVSIGFDGIGLVERFRVGDTGQHLTPKADSILTFYGIDKVLPLAIVFLLIVLAQANSRVFRVIGSLIPLHLSSDPLRVFITANSANLLILRANHREKDLDQIRTTVDYAIANEKIGSSPELQRLQVDEEATRSMSHFVKGLAAIILIVTTISLIFPAVANTQNVDVRRVLFIALAFTVILVYLAVRRMKLDVEIAQLRVRTYLNWLTAQDKLVPVDFSRTVDTDEVTKARQDLEKGCWAFHWRLHPLENDVERQIRYAFVPRRLRPMLSLAASGGVARAKDSINASVGR